MADGSLDNRITPEGVVERCNFIRGATSSDEDLDGDNGGGGAGEFSSPDNDSDPDNESIPDRYGELNDRRGFFQLTSTCARNENKAAV